MYCFEFSTEERVQAGDTSTSCMVYCSSKLPGNFVFSVAQAGDQSKSQEWKLKLEELQRRDRRLRKEGGGYAEH